MTKFTVKEREEGKPCFACEEESRVYFEIDPPADLERDLGQKEAELEKTQADLEEASEVQLSHMEGGKAAKAALKQKAKIRTK